ncbi:N-acetyl-gamma-glutamyl-phosphate reductase [Roseisolibacter agri]|uniref:N-acetyl-gamma-glutamyl-phosphate reductase n=1 Tax=Roseisolibacter agri TaxID=2014610 RepID=A0AA37Q7M3_9BACT|nr:Asd/ArgC dimerization domain-containing protein [Roseisolibacter agri]GLC24496.1 N-acetyl-gamma-glutamyl-phosphate/N-acetyl-gamma- aminoadipyl-phosphate reductase [Roseisolibacter agri]
MNNIPVGILGASGYAGRELCALVAAHPQLTLAFATADRRRGETVRVPAPLGVAGRPTDVTFVATDDAPLGDAALVFSALPHGASAEWSRRAHEAGAKVVDLSSDLRPGHLTSELLATLGARRSALALTSAGVSAERRAPTDEESSIPYGLTELNREAVRAAEVVANPGCYPTAILVALAPLARAGLLATGATVVADAASGVTGAGNSPREDLLFGEVTGSFRAYGAGNVHRHLPEMRATLGALGADVDLIFTPHLLPVARGILATCTVPVTAAPADALAVWRDAYAGEPFVEVVDALPSLADVQHRNVVRLTVLPVKGVRTPTLQVFAAIDNLMKGAAGQAVQNANLMLGLDETAGLPR